MAENALIVMRHTHHCGEETQMAIIYVMHVVCITK